MTEQPEKWSWIHMCSRKADLSKIHKDRTYATREDAVDAGIRGSLDTVNQQTEFLVFGVAPNAVDYKDLDTYRFCVADVMDSRIECREIGFRGENVEVDTAWGGKIENVNDLQSEFVKFMAEWFDKNDIQVVNRYYWHRITPFYHIKIKKTETKIIIQGKPKELGEYKEQ